MMIKRKVMGYLLIPFCYLLLTACGQSSGNAVTPVTSVSLTVTGLESALGSCSLDSCKSGVLVGLNDSEFVTLTDQDNGGFTFSSNLSVGTSYSVTVITQPASPSQFCTVTNGSGTIGVGTGGFPDPVDNVVITCVTVAALTSVNGEWLSNCVVEGAISSKTTIINTNGTGSISEQTYSDTTCTTTSMLQGAEYTYELRDAVTVDGTVDGITTATKINVTYTSGVVGSEFNIVAIKDAQVMYFGDGGTTDALRPTQLDGSVVFTKQ